MKKGAGRGRGKRSTQIKPRGVWVACSATGERFHCPTYGYVLTLFNDFFWFISLILDNVSGCNCTPVFMKSCALASEATASGGSG